MEYNIHELAVLAGVSTRTLRYYDQIDLLKPSRMGGSGYRFYGSEEVDLLQQILFFRERRIPLAGIRELLKNPDFDRMAAMQEHLAALRGEQEKLAKLIGCKHVIRMTKKLKSENFRINLTNDENTAFFKFIS